MIKKIPDAQDNVLENPVYGRVLRSLRSPLLLLLSAYALSIAGFLLIPGVDDEGNRYRMNFFEALYFVSFMASTIGFGELPYPFTDAQRLWTLICIYMTVISWLYTITYLIALLLDDEFQRALRTRNFVKQVRRIRDPFYLICGVDDTGIAVAEGLHRNNIRTVGIDIREDSRDTRRRTVLRMRTPILQDDAGKASVLKAAGLKHSQCKGVFALSPSDSTNLKIAITTRILNPRMPVYGRAETKAAADNMASFDTTHILNAYQDFSNSLDLAFDSPNLFTLRNMITARPGSPVARVESPPIGRWIVCGYGRFGKAVSDVLKSHGCEVAVIETDRAGTQAPPGTILDTGTEETTLRRAGITDSVGIVAGTDDDTNNLSIVITAANIIPDLYLITRQNKNENDEIFCLAPHNLNAQNSDIVAARILEIAITPLARDFIDCALRQSDAWAAALIDRIATQIDDHVPEFWSIHIDVDAKEQAAAKSLRLADIMAGRDNPITGTPTDCIVLLKHRGKERSLLPAPDEAVKLDDEFYLCGTAKARARMRAYLIDTSAKKTPARRIGAAFANVARRLRGLWARLR